MPVFHAGQQPIHYEEAGRGEPLVFVHSLGSSGRIWTAQLREFARDYHAVAPDLRGHGRSPRSGPVTLRAMAEDLAALLEHLGGTPAHLVGISMGGVILQELFGMRPDLVASLALACTFSEMDPQVAAARLRDREEFLEKHGMAEFAARYVADTLLPGTPQAVKGELEAVIAGIDKTAYLEAARAVFTARTTPVLGRIGVPTLVIGAELDKGYPPESIRALAARIPGARTAFIPGAAHLANLDNPDAFNRALREFLGSLRTRGEASRQGDAGGTTTPGPR